MAAERSQWQLFGLDLGAGVHYWQAGWREIAWGQDSLLRRWLDEPVRVHDSGASALASLDSTDSHQGKLVATAYVIPDEMQLVKSLQLPAAIEADLASALEFEIRAHSPFPKNDTSAGWAVESRTGDVINVELVIVSRSSINRYLRDVAGVSCDDVEVWSRSRGLSIVINGFGEDKRFERYQKRLKRVLYGTFYCLLMLMLIPAVPVVAKQQQLNKLERQLQRVQTDAADAVRLREDLSASNEQARRLNQLLAGRHDPYDQLHRLTVLLEDDVWLSAFELRENLVRIDGRARNAASVMQMLSEQPGYSEVRAPSAIRRETTGEERFVLDITLLPGGSR